MVADVAGKVAEMAAAAAEGTHVLTAEVAAQHTKLAAAVAADASAGGTLETQEAQVPNPFFCAFLP